MRFIGGFRMKAPLAQVVTTVPKRRWKRAVSSDGTEESETGQVAEVTDLVDLSGWPAGTRMIARRELPHPGAQLNFTDVDGYRYQVFVTDLADADICYLEALFRGRGRIECAIRDAKDTGLANLPSHSFAINAAWLTLCSSPVTCWPGRRGSASTASWPEPSPSGCATRSCTARDSSSPRPGAAACGSLAAGRGPTTSSTPSDDCPRG